MDTFALRCYHRHLFFRPNNGTSKKILLALSFLVCFHRELLEIPLGFSSADDLAPMSSPLISVSSPIGEVLNVFGCRFIVAALRRQTEPPPLNNYGTLIVASPYRVQRLDHLDLSTVA
ncbi:hypothetical protein ES332_A10G237500v1 [Gossypium tomentosum]|uniref:Uncharacterized protein n=1 Tax=Gossypium tomentosum TaxID=34277 RepID=A0A5D2NTY6_GOSTO|nr:hypothetical protein ES332_A10G237500v1 [Gossypium tomentosum]